MDQQILLTPDELIARWKGSVSLRTLEGWRYKKTGPDYMKIGNNVLYALEAIVAYETEQTRQ